MGFVRNALIGIALYEAVRYFLKKEEPVYTGIPDVKPGPRRHVSDDLSIGNNPEANLTGPGPEADKNDPWKQSLADDELRAPDS